MAQRTGRSRLRLDLATDGDLHQEAEGLIGLGATRVEGDAMLADPDGNEFRLLDARPTRAGSASCHNTP